MKTKKRMKIKTTIRTVFILTAVLFFGLCFNLLDFDFGNEAAAAAFPITNCTELQNMQNDLSADYYLVNDIDCSGTVTWDGGAGFEPVGTFTGNFDGQGHKIKDLYINRPFTDYIGLFGSVRPITGSESVIKNVALENVNIVGGTEDTTENYIGGLVGDNSGTISNCHSTSNITAGMLSDYIGGLVGDNSGTISNCHSTSNITVVRGKYIGGLVGLNTGIINNCYFTGNMNITDITAGMLSNFIGGLVGFNHGLGTISDCHSTGDVDVTRGFNIGGLVGQNQGKLNKSYSTGDITVIAMSNFIGGLVGFNHDLGTISNCYSTGDITVGNSSDFIGGLAGDSRGTAEYCYSAGRVIIGGFDCLFVGGLIGKGTINKSYWDTETSGQSSSAGGEGKTTVEMMQQATFVDWNFINIWNINEGITYPFLRQDLCSGNVSLNLAPNPSAPSASITAIASGLSDCNGKTIRIKQNSCSGTQKCSCSVSGTGCSCTFTAPAAVGNHTYYACIDKNNDSDYADSGEKDSEVLVVKLDCAFENESCLSMSCCSSPPAPEPLICVDNICNSCLSLNCSADDAEDNSVSEMGDAIDDVYCTWNIHDGCLVKEGVETVDGGNNPDYWEGENCADSGSSDLWGEKKVYIDDINDYNIKGKVCVDDYNSFWINGAQVNVLENGSTGCVGLTDVRSFFQTGWNTIKFKAVDTCSPNRYMDIDWEVISRAPDLNGIASSSSTISLSWSDRGAGITYGLWNSDIGAYIYNGDQTSFDHTGLNANTTYSYQVIATKNGYDSDWSNTVSVTTWNQLPVADAGPNQSAVIIGNTVDLDGSGSYDPDGDSITYNWTFNSIPAASSLTDADFSDETIVNPSFTPDVIGVYLIDLTVTDSYGGFNTDTVSITVADLKICGDDIIQCLNSSGLCEECDGTDDDLCPGECIAPGEIRECLCPQSMPSWKEVHPKN